jgi:fatty acid desaturase
VETTAELVHDHDLKARRPYALPKAVLLELSKLDVWKGLSAIAVEWISIALAVALCVQFWNPVLYVATVIFVGARQHALAIIGHDASHFRLLKNRALNDWVSDLFAKWPTLGTTRGYRYFHSAHHIHLGTEKDLNRVLWKTHTLDGELTKEWTYPKTALGLLGKIVYRGCGLTGLYWIYLRFKAMFTFGSKAQAAYNLLQLLFTATLFTLLTYFHLWKGYLLYWLVPFCTWYIAANYIRLILEHSAIDGEAPYNATRTTTAGSLARLLVLSRATNYHIEHHLFPSIPFYNLRKAHEYLMQQPDYRSTAHITSGLVAGLRECARGSRQPSS